MNTDKRRFVKLACFALVMLASAQSSAVAETDLLEIEFKPAFTWTSACFAGEGMEKVLTTNPDAPKQTITLEQPFRNRTGWPVESTEVAGEIVGMEWQFPETVQFMQRWSHVPKATHVFGWRVAGGKHRFRLEPRFPDSQKVLPESKPVPASRIDSSIPAPTGDIVGMEWQFSLTEKFMSNMLSPYREEVFSFGGIAFSR